ncbi:MAG: hypothetical protein BWY57_00773 [Betaproteobacteria bacterium ADurb.Bin341]|nr:MAG: hypothetical protein BWY57_00773 [Betaproteobacteria bacterium ADurb.Bin341]
MGVTFFDARAENEFGKELASAVIEYLSARNLGKTDKKIFEKERAMIDRIINLVCRYRNEHRLNFYKKAKLANSFKWALLESGCSTDFVDEMTKILVIQLR